MAKVTTKKTSSTKGASAPKYPVTKNSTQMSDDISIGTILSKAWELLSEGRQIWAQFALIIAIPTVLIAYLLGKIFDIDGLNTLAFDPSTLSKVAGGAAVIALVAGIYSLVISALLVQVSVNNAKGTKLKDLKSTIEIGKDKLGMIMLTILVVGLIIGIGSVFLVIPGIIAAFLLGLSIYIIAETELTLSEAFKLSFKYASTYYIQMVLLALVLIGLSIGLSIALSIFSVLPSLLEVLVTSTFQAVLQIYGMLTAAVLYLEIKKRFKDDSAKS